MKLITPREDQRSVKQQVFSLLQNNPAVLVVAPTGFGKTVVMGDIALEEVERGGRVMQVVNLQVLLGQTIATMIHGFGVKSSALHDKIQQYLYEGCEFNLECNYQNKILVTMPRTLNNTVAGVNDLLCPKAHGFEPTMIQFDEAHKATSAEFQAIRKLYPNAKVVGFTATPYREKNDPGESLEEWYGDNIVIAATMSELIERGDLARPIYTECAAEAHLALTWMEATKDSENKRTIIFTDDTDHSKQIEAQFLKYGIKAEVVTAGKGLEGDEDYVARQSTATRNAIFGRFHRGETDVLISVNALCEGFDEAAAKYCFLTRRVANIALYQQMVGRVLRKYLGKPEGFIYDFAGNFKEHGPVEAIEWPRAKKGLLVAARESIRANTFNKKEKVWTRCEDCGHVYNIKSRKTCAICGTAHGVSLVCTVSEKVGETLKMSEKEFAVFASRLPAALQGLIKPEILNSRYKMEIFTNGQIREDLKFLPTVVELYNRAPKTKKNAVWNGDLKLAA